MMLNSDENPFQDPSVSDASGTGDATAGGSDATQEASPPWLANSVDPSSGQSWASASTHAEPGGPPAPPATKPGYTLDQLITYMRLANVAAAILMVTSALTTLITNVDLSTAVIAIYISCFGCLMCCFETHLKQISIIIADNFGFMYSAKGRFIFLVLLATLCFALNTLGKITGGLLCGVALFNAYVIFKFPEYEKETQEADLRGESPQSVQTMASSYAVNYIQSNPEQAASWAETGATWAMNNPDAAMRAAGAAGGSSQPQNGQRIQQPAEPSFDL